MSLYDHLPVVHDTGEILVDDRTNWEDEKLRSLSVSDVINIEKRAQRIFDCSSSLTFIADNTGKKHLHVADFCKDRMCPSCQRRRSLKVFHQVKEVCTELLSREPTTKFLLLTLTVPNVHRTDLPSTISHMMKSFERLFRSVRVKRSTTGWFRSLEITKEKKDREGYYHPHFHVLISVPSTYVGKNYIKQKDWLLMWQKCTRQPEITQVDVRRIRPNKKGIKSGELSTNEFGGSSQASVAGAAAEVGKYATKPSDYISQNSDGSYVADPDTVNVLAGCLHGTRIIAWGGILKIIKNELDLDDVDSDSSDLVHVDGKVAVIDAVMRQVYTWNSFQGFYIN
jgi:plasmid rolling circle replication initiator protein Rep